MVARMMEMVGCENPGKARMDEVMGRDDAATACKVEVEVETTCV